jgi:hypothetical protein
LRAQRAGIFSRAVSSLLLEAALMPSILLAGSIASCPKSSLSPKPHTWFNIRSEGENDRIWRAVVFDEEELGPAVSLLAVGDACAIVGKLDVHVATDSLGRKRIAFCVTVKQLLLLRRRSPAAVRASNFLEPPAAGGIVARSL